MNNLTSKPKCKYSITTKCKTKAGNFTTNEMATVELCLTEFSAKEIVTWKCHFDDYTKSRYGMILVRYVLNMLGTEHRFLDT